jgi:hypothetical protein
MSLLLAPVLLVLILAFGARFLCRTQPQPRRKPRESEAEARVILLGTYRVYTWLVLLVALSVAVGWLTGEQPDSLPAWYGVILAAVGSALLAVSHALYWRLGYDRRRWLFVLGHLTGAFCLAEYLWALRRDMEKYLRDHPEAGKPLRDSQFL